MPIGQQYRDALGVLRVKGPPMPNGQYRDALGVLRGAALGEHGRAGGQVIPRPGHSHVRGEATMKARFSTMHSDGSTITFAARIVKDNGDGTVWVEMPERVRRLPFPPLGGKRFGLYEKSTLVIIK